MPDSTVFRILMILSSHGDLGEDGRKTGVWLESFVAPYFLFRDAGADVVLASPAGGMPPIDPASREIPFATAARFAEDECCRDALADTLPLAEVCAGDFDAAFYPAGFGACWDLAADTASGRLIGRLLDAGRPVVLVAQATSALCMAQDAAGRLRAAGRTVTGYPDSAAVAAGLAELLPVLPERDLRRLGAQFTAGSHTTVPHVVQDDLLITAAMPGDAEAAARCLLQAIPGFTLSTTLQP